ncbi:MAG: LptA/OstA family protein [Thermodesulfobacteriota bacterium]
MSAKRKGTRSLGIIGIIGLATYVFLSTGTGFGAEKKGEGNNRPIVTTADTLELDNKNRIATFTGTVVARQEQPGKDPIVIECDKMVIHYTGEPEKKAAPVSSKTSEKKDALHQGQVEKIVASGRVRVVQGKDVATGETAVFYNADQKIILTGKAEFWQGKNLVKGEEITVWIKENRSLVTSKGKNRVKAVIHQEEK